MAALAKNGTPSLASLLPPPNDKLALIAGEAIAAGDAVYIKSDGLYWLSTGAAANAAAVVEGFALSAAAAGEALTAGYGIRMEYATGMTPGTSYYLSGTVPGGLDTVASTGGTVVVARAVDTTRLHLRKSW